MTRAFTPFLLQLSGVFLFGLLVASPPAHALLDKVEALSQQNVAVSAMVVDLSRGRIIAQHNPDSRLTPASVTKLYIDAAALKHWGPNHRFITPLLTNGSIRDNTLHGDLMLVGSGDPGLNTERLWTLVMRLKQSGVTKITGELIVNDSLFGPVECHTEDRCDALKASASSYDAPISAAGSNYSTIEIFVKPSAKVGAPATLSLLPPALQYPMEGSIDTTSTRGRALYGVRRVTEEGRDTLHAYGKVPSGGGPYHVYRSVSDSARHTGDLLAALIRESGITLQGGVYVHSNPVPTGFVQIAETHSDNLSDQLGRLMAYSNNYMSDVLTMGIAADKHKAPNYTLPQASRVLEEMAADVNRNAPQWLRPAREPKSPLVIHSGSGLSITNRLSARDLVSLLAHMHDDFSLFPSYVGSLPVPRFAPSRMLRRNVNRDWMTRLAAKTGYLSEPVSVLSLSGYFRLKDGGWGAFAFVTNGTQKRRNAPTHLTLGAIKADMQEIMQKY